MGNWLSNAWNNLGDQINEGERKAREAPQHAADEANRLRKEAEQKVKDAAAKATAEAKKLADKAKEDAKKAYDKFKEADKKIKKRLSDLGGRVRKAYKKLLRKAMLKMMYNSIRMNVHGWAVKLYPAIAPVGELKQRRFSASYRDKAIKVYNELANKWVEMGGDKSKLDDAIRQGQSKAIFKWKKNPYAAENKGVGIMTVSHKIGATKSGFDGYSVDGDDEDGSAEFDSGSDVTSGSTNTTTADDNSELNDAGVDGVSAPEKHAKWHHFMAWVIHLFHKHKADEESPYQPDAPEKGANDDQTNADKANTDELSKTPTADIDKTMTETNPTIADDKDKGESTTMGNSTSGGSKKNGMIGAAAGAVVLGAIAFFAFPSKRKFLLPTGIIAGAGIGYVAGQKLIKNKVAEMPKDPSKK